MDKEVKITMVGIGGYGNTYFSAILKSRESSNFKLNGIVDPFARDSSCYEQVKELEIPVFDNLEDFYRNDTADLVVISTPIHLHVPFSLIALNNGSSVLCEKPVCGSYQDALELIKAEQQNPGFVAIGYQWSFSEAIQRLKNDILAGRFGQPLRFKVLASWPRTDKYYGRNNWAGKLKSGDYWVLDSPANNATAHYLHNMFYLLGKEINESAMPLKVKAELYKANQTENFDTAFIRCKTEDKREIYFCASHAVASPIGPIGYYEFENAVVHHERGDFIARLKNGEMVNYGNPNDNGSKKLWDCVKAIQNGLPVACGVKAASAQTLCVNGAQESMPEMVDFPQELVEIITQESGEKLTSVRTLQDIMVQSYSQGLLPSELGSVPWSKEGKEVVLDKYEKFPSINFKA